MDKTFADVALEAAARQTFQYRVPEDLRAQIDPGKRVRVPFRSRRCVGYCVGLSDVAKVQGLRDILEVLDPEPLTSPAMLELTHWMAEHYWCSWGQTLAATLPVAVRTDSGGRSICFVRPTFSREELASKLETIGKRAYRQRRVLEVLFESADEMTKGELIKAVGCTPQVIQALRRRELIRFVWRRVEKDPFLSGAVAREEPLTPTSEQAVILKRISDLTAAEQFGVMLIYGVTGSGKTEIYLQAIAEIVAKGKQAIVLVPEISLTPQTVRRFRVRFESVAVLHSGLTPAARRDQWRRVQSGEAQVVVGARSAIFAATRSLGLIVVDEEHETSFKQESVPRYQARDVAVKRGELEGVPVILGSATPSLESYHRAQEGNYELGVLSKRVEERPMPPVKIVDMALESTSPRDVPYLSRLLEMEMAQALGQGGQIILFLNRRGYSTFVFCPRCRAVVRCEHCDIALTHEKRFHRLFCRYCNRQKPVPEKCPECLHSKLLFFGMGTERIEEEVRRKLGGEVTVSRMDSDTMRTHRLLEQTLADFREGKIQVLVGTQMIAKGLDFPNVTLVGVVAADITLNLPDFRSGERTFQLVAQVSGRTGRGPKGGRVIVQSYTPDHFSIRCAAEHDYEEFARHELEYRRQTRYPPFGRMVRLVIQDTDAPRGGECAIRLGAVLGRIVSRHGAVVKGPAQCIIKKIRGKFRWHLLVCAPDAPRIRAILHDLHEEAEARDLRRVTLDVDPISMM